MRIIILVSIIISTIMILILCVQDMREQNLSAPEGSGLVLVDEGYGMQVYELSNTYIIVKSQHGVAICGK